MRNEFTLNSLSLDYLINAYNTTQDKSTFFNEFFIKLAGTKNLQSQIEEGLSENEIKKTWKKGLDLFKETRQKYLLYK